MNLRSARFAMLSLVVTVSACTAPTATPIPMTLPTPASVVEVADLQRAVLDIDYADELALAQGYVWVKTNNGHVVQVNPADNTIVGEVKVDTTLDIEHHCMGLGTDGHHIWACSARGGFDEAWDIDVVAIDPASRQVIATIPVDKIWDQITLPYLDNRMWVLTGDGSKLVGIDTTTFEPGPAIDLGTRCTSLALSGATLVAACPLDNLVLRVDPATAAVTQRASVPEPMAIGANAAAVWVLGATAVLRLDPVTLAQTAVFTGMASVGLQGGIFVSDEAVWIRRPGTFLYRIDPASNQIGVQIVSEKPQGGGSVMATADSVWTSDNEFHRLYRLDFP